MAFCEGTLGEAHRVDLGPASTLLPRGCEVPESHLAHGTITGMTWIQSGIFLWGYNMIYII